ncbi:MAG: hypothetical protein AAF909_15700, partial [Pseudomonadota bacterium]
LPAAFDPAIGDDEPDPAGPRLTPRALLEALERLEAAGAVATDRLRLAYGAHASAESGGVWGRVEVYRGALEASDAAFEEAVLRALARADQGGRRASMARLLAPEIAVRALPETTDPSARSPGDLRAVSGQALRWALRAGGEAEAAAAIGRRADAAAGPGIPGTPRSTVERALDDLIAPLDSDPLDPATLTALAREADAGDRRAAFIAEARRILGGADRRTGGAGPFDPGAMSDPFSGFSSREDGAEGDALNGPGPSARSDPRWEIAAGRGALTAIDAASGLGALPAPGDPGAFDAGLIAVETFAALGWTRDARRLAAEIAASL